MTAEADSGKEYFPVSSPDELRPLGGKAVADSWGFVPPVESESVWNCCINVKREKAHDDRTLATFKYYTQYDCNRVAHIGHS